ncbi:MAG: Gfo/Idh/MocA family oxidoreductase [Candidatus Latescibacterota bacterium]|nr:Gfo/Idh/MocA family oxidoreductase [Candidatus Latescibacterota bacterium]
MGIFGGGSWARRTHIPHLQNIGAEVVAVCDTDEATRNATAEEFSIPARYANGHEMLAAESLDALYSCVPGYARTDVEAAAAHSGVHLFSEKPQATSMIVAQRIADAVDEGGVLSTVCFRERYRPLFQQAKSLLADKQVVHLRFSIYGGLPSTERPESGKHSWGYSLEKGGFNAYDWGVHSIDYSRYMTGLDVAVVQAFFHDGNFLDRHYTKPLSCSYHLVFENGATGNFNFINAGQAPPDTPWFTVFYEGGYIAVYGYDRIEQNGEVVYIANEFDPWYEQDRVFIDAVATGDGSGILNDYRDGLKSLAPVLAGWQSARSGGTCIDVSRFLLASLR